MIIRISSLEVQDPLNLLMTFDDGRCVLYDVAEDVCNNPVFEPLASLPGLFEQARLDESRTCVYWNEDIDLPSDTIWEYGMPLTQ